VRSPVTVPELVADPVPEPLNRTVPELAPPQAPPVVLVAADRDREVVDDIDYSALEDPFQGPSMNWAIGVGGGGHSGGGTAGKGEADPASAPGVPEKPAGATRKARKIASLCAAPSYPKRERRRGVEGVVKVRVHIDADGHVLEVELLESSGSRGLDEAALEAVEGWTFEPALKDGTAVDAWATTDIRFGLS
jgi:protein TonB